MSPNRLNVSILDTPFDPSNPESKIIRYRGAEKYKLYKIWLYLEGIDLVFVRSVTYILHATFKEREHTIHRTYDNPSFKLPIFTWGIFEVRAIVEAKGVRYELKSLLRYDEKFSDPNVRFIKEDN